MGRDEPTAGDPSSSDRLPAEPENPVPDRFTKRFVQTLAFVSVVFLVAMLFVFREVEHSRELYRMSRLIAHAEAQKRQWQERQRLQEVREARFAAELHQLQSTTRNPGFTHAGFASAEPWP